MRRYTIKVNDTAKVVDVEAVGANLFRVQIDGRHVDVELTDHRDLGHGSITPVVQTRQPRAEASGSGGVAGAAGAAAGPGAGVASGTAGTGAAASGSGEPRVAGGGIGPAPAAGGARDKMTAPMPGVILSVGVAAGASVKRGDPIMVLEAMKMKNELRAPRDGVVAEVYVSAGQQVRFGEFLVRFEG